MKLLSAERLVKAAKYNQIPGDIILQGLLANYKPSKATARKILNAVRSTNDPQGKGSPLYQVGKRYGVFSLSLPALR
jgi:hypothetical protein